MHSLSHYHLDSDIISLNLTLTVSSCIRCESSSSLILPIVPPRNSSSVKTKGSQSSGSQNLVIEIVLNLNVLLSLFQWHCFRLVLNDSILGQSHHKVTNQ